MTQFHGSASFGALREGLVARRAGTLMPIDAQRELQIDERVYDVSSWIRKHPGGSIIKFQLSARTRPTRRLR